MQSYPTYTTYNDSGLDWLGEIPEHWEITRLGTLFKERRIKVSDKNYPPLSVTKNGVVPQLETAAKTTDGDNRKGVIAGDFVINSRSDRKGSSGVAKQDGSVSLINIVLEPRGVNSQYCEYLLKSYEFKEEYYRFGRGIVDDLWTTRFSEMKGMMLPLPPLPEQRAIAAFLDHKTAEIQRFISLKQETIRLLQERKTALINQAVTRGLDPSVELKDSGVEWLGEVPKHWEVKKLKYLAKRIIDTEHKTVPFYPDGQFLVVRTTNIKEGKLTLKGAKYTNEEGYKGWTRRAVPQEGDVMFTREAPAGEACLVPSGIPLCVGQRVVLFQLYKDQIYPPFCVYSIYSEIIKKFVINFSSGSTVVHFNMSDIKEIPFFLPPIQEQLAITEYLNSNLEELDQAISQAQQEIDLITEYQQSLVSEAVTGKIDIQAFNPQN